MRANKDPSVALEVQAQLLAEVSEELHTFFFVFICFLTFFFFNFLFLCVDEYTLVGAQWKNWRLCLERLSLLGQRKPRSLAVLQLVDHVAKQIDTDDRADLLLDAALLCEKWFLSFFFFLFL